MTVEQAGNSAAFSAVRKVLSREWAVPGRQRSSSMVRRTGVECSLCRFEASWQLLELREEESQDSRLHDQAEVGPPRRAAIGPFWAWWCDLWAAVLFSAKFKARSGPGIPWEWKGCTAGSAFP